MPLDVDALLRLWLEPLGDQEVAEAAFRRFYADPVTVNGVAFSVSELVDRARTAQATYADLGGEIDDVVAAPGRAVLAFRMRGRHVGDLNTTLGVVPATGRFVEFRVIDLLTVRDGVVTDIWMLADEMGLLTQLGVVALTVPSERVTGASD
jgi:predicted ester cyclase